jgi:hypothetical protein
MAETIKSGFRVSSKKPQNQNVDFQHYKKKDKKVWREMQSTSKDEEGPSTSTHSVSADVASVSGERNRAKLLPNPFSSRYSNASKKSNRSFDSNHSKESTESARKRQKSESVPMITTFADIGLNFQGKQSKKMNLYVDREIKEMHGYEVTVVHIRDPNYFYVHYKEWTTKFKLGVDMRCDREGPTSPTITVLSPRDIYLMFDESEKRWVRVRYESLHGEPGTDATVKVFFIDYGTEKYVSINQLRECSDDLEHVPSGAKACSIYNLRPKTETWCDDTSYIFEDMVSKFVSKILVIYESLI